MFNCKVNSFIYLFKPVANQIYLNNDAFQALLVLLVLVHCVLTMPSVVQRQAPASNVNEVTANANYRTSRKRNCNLCMFEDGWGWEEYSDGYGGYNRFRGSIRNSGYGGYYGGYGNRYGGNIPRT